MALVTTPTGQQFEETGLRALEYYQREPGYTVGGPAADAAPAGDGEQPAPDGEQVTETTPARRRGQSD